MSATTTALHTRPRIDCYMLLDCHIPGCREIVEDQEDHTEVVVPRTGAALRHMEAGERRRDLAYHHNKEAGPQVARTLPEMETMEVDQVVARSSDSLG
jgi:hypothetical protein